MIVLRRILYLGATSLFIVLGGLIFLAIGLEAPAFVLTTGPSAMIFYLMPASLTHRLSETVLFLVGMASAVVFWAVLLNVVYAVITWAHRRRDPI